MMQSSFNLEQTQFHVQSMQDTAVSMAAMRGAHQAMQQQMGVTNMDDIEDLYDDLEDMMDFNNEVQELMTRSFEMPYDVDEADLEAELEAFDMEPAYVDEEEIPSYLQDMASVPDTSLDLPAVPSTPISANM